MNSFRGSFFLYFLLTFIIILCKFYFVSNSEIAPPFYGLDRPSLDYELPPLRYGFDELEPYVDENSLRIHYFEVHKKYMEETNTLLKKWRRFTAKAKFVTRLSIVEILRNISQVPLKFRADLKQFGSGYLNHNLYWAVMSPNPAGVNRLPHGKIAEEIAAKFGSFIEFKNTFSDMALNVFGSGYTWLCRNKSADKKFGELVIVSMPNEDCPLSTGMFPILGIDVWEHAYLMNRYSVKEKYIENWWLLVDWQQVNDLSDWWKKLNLHDEL